MRQWCSSWPSLYKGTSLPCSRNVVPEDLSRRWARGPANLEEESTLVSHTRRYGEVGGLLKARRGMQHRHPSNLRSAYEWK